MRRRGLFPRSGKSGPEGRLPPPLKIFFFGPLERIDFLKGNHEFVWKPQDRPGCGWRFLGSTRRFREVFP